MGHRVEIDTMWYNTMFNAEIKTLPSMKLKNHLTKINMKIPRRKCYNIIRDQRPSYEINKNPSQAFKNSSREKYIRLDLQTWLDPWNYYIVSSIATCPGVHWSAPAANHIFLASTRHTQRALALPIFGRGCSVMFFRELRFDGMSAFRVQACHEIRYRNKQ